MLAGGRSSVYRFHLDSPIPFTKSIKATIEHGSANHRSDNFYSVAYWYQAEPHAPFPALPPVEQRLPACSQRAVPAMLAHPHAKPGSSVVLMLWSDGSLHAGRHLGDDGCRFPDRSRRERAYRLIVFTGVLPRSHAHRRIPKKGGLDAQSIPGDGPQSGGTSGENRAGDVRPRVGAGIST